MRIRPVFSVVLVSLLALGLGCKRDGSPAPTKESGGGAGAVAELGLAGTYAITKGENPGGKGVYSGQVKVAPNGSVHDLQWFIGGKLAYSGVAIASGNILGVGWGIGGTYGVVVYKIRSGKLEGVWAGGGSGAVGTEVLSGAAGLTGAYEVVEGKTPSGGKYTGTVTITKKATDLYAVDWRLSNGSYSGVGIQEDDVLVVGYGSGGQGAGVVSYRMASGVWTGRWATPGSTSFGNETLKKN
jgi:hypothetical protein